MASPSYRRGRNRFERGLIAPGTLWNVTVAMWAVAASMWDAKVSIWAVTVSMVAFTSSTSVNAVFMCDLQVLCGLLHPLCGLL